jgi:hypothetical protein
VKYFAGFIGIILLAGFSFFFLSQTKTAPPAQIGIDGKAEPSNAVGEKVDHKASFAIYTNGTLRIFTDPKYHNLSSDVFIEATSPNTVNVKKTGITWGDFFKTLPMKLDKNCLITGTGQVFCSNGAGTLKFFINGEKNDDALQEEIKDGSEMLVSFGPKNDPNVTSQLEKLSQE